MNPPKFESLWINYAYAHKKYYDDQYPAATNCVVLDQHIARINEDIADILKRKLMSINNELISTRVPNPTPKKPSDIIYSNYIYTPNANALGIAANARDKSLDYLRTLLQQKENASAIADCRNKIETVRQDESAGLFSTASTAAEVRILDESKKKQYLLIGIGAAVLLTVLVIALRKK